MDHGMVAMPAWHGRDAGPFCMHDGAAVIDSIDAQIYIPDRIFEKVTS
jgi:hypothetical protein